MSKLDPQNNQTWQHCRQNPIAFYFLVSITNRLPLRGAIEFHFFFFFLPNWPTLNIRPQKQNKHKPKRKTFWRRGRVKYANIFHVIGNKPCPNARPNIHRPHTCLHDFARAEGPPSWIYLYIYIYDLGPLSVCIARRKQTGRVAGNLLTSKRPVARSLIASDGWQQVRFCQLS